MNKFNTIVAMCVFGLMVSASHADDMSDSMEPMMDSDEMPMDKMEMEKEMEMMDEMDDMDMNDDSMN